MSLRSSPAALPEPSSEAPVNAAEPARAPRVLPLAEHWGALLVIAPLCVAALRQAGEVILGVAWPEGPVLQNFVVFYAVTELVVLWLLHVTTGRRLEELAGFVAAGLVLGALPPVLDGLVFRRTDLHYVYFGGLRWLFLAPEQPLGETAVVWLTLAAIAAFAGWVTRRAAPTLAAAAGAYALMQVIGGGLPGLVQWLIPERHGPRLVLHHVLMLSLGLACFAALRRQALGYSCRRLNHALPFVCLTLLGARLSGDHWALAAIKGAVILLSSLLVVAANDWFDRHQDAATRAPRSMEAGDIWVLAFLQVLVGCSVAWFLREALLGVVLLAATTLAYHHPATRLKRWIALGYAAEAVAALACFLAGAVRPAPPFLLAAGPVALGLAAAPAGFFCCSPFKDYKDVEDDRRAGVQSVYTLLARHGVEPRRTNRVVAAVLGGCLAAATALLAGAGASVPATLALAALAVAAPPSLLAGSPRAAVERTIWVVSAFLLVAALAAPSGTAVAGAPRFPYASPAICDPP